MKINEGKKNSCSASKISLPASKKAPRISVTFLLLVCLLAFSWIYSSYTTSSAFTRTIGRKKERLEYAVDCLGGNVTRTCSSNYPTTSDAPTTDDTPSNMTCPDYFHWIYEDLKPFMSTGIRRDMVESAKSYSNFRLVILKGKVYVERYEDCMQSREWYTIWGIVQLLRRYPGRLPDLELMFDCNDRPVEQKWWYERSNASVLPPLFRYCGYQGTQNIVFPDFSFWGCAALNLRPWEIVSKELEEEKKRIKWMDREPYAFWKGNPNTTKIRRTLLQCNVSEKGEWNARLFRKDWYLEFRQGFKQSDVAKHCNYRYNIYVEGFAWSTSAKYILACDSPTLLIKTSYYDFFLRSLQPLQHYWPLRDNDMCRSVKFAVDWGNNNKEKAQSIGKDGSRFIKEELKMDFVYDYMFHLLNEYAKLLRFEPKVPEGAIEMCSETMGCYEDGRHYTIMMESLVKSPSITSPCTLPSPYDPGVLETFLRRKDDSRELVEKWERKFWEDPTSTVY